MQTHSIILSHYFYILITRGNFGSRKFMLTWLNNNIWQSLKVPTTGTRRLSEAPGNNPDKYFTYAIHGIIFNGWKWSFRFLIIKITSGDPVSTQEYSDSCNQYEYFRFERVLRFMAFFKVQTNFRVRNTRGINLFTRMMATDHIFSTVWFSLLTASIEKESDW